MDLYTTEYLVIGFLVTVHLAVLVLLGIADHLPALPGQHHTQLWSSVMALHQTFHLGAGQTIISQDLESLCLEELIIRNVFTSLD